MIKIVFCQPFITDAIIEQSFGGHAEFVKAHFLQPNENGTYHLHASFNTQRKVEAYFQNQESTEDNKAIEQGLFCSITTGIPRNRVEQVLQKLKDLHGVELTRVEG